MNDNFRPAGSEINMNFAVITLLATMAIIVIILLAVHIGFRAPRCVERSSPARYGLCYEDVSIETVGGKKLFAWWLPTALSEPTLIIVHGWGGNAELMLPLALPLHRAGLNILLLDARNHGRSDSDSYSSLPRFAEDTGAAVEWVKAQNTDTCRQIVLLGHSVGAAAVLFEASRRNDIAAVISIAAFAHPEWMMRRYLDRFRLPGFLKAWILRYIEWVIGYRYAEIAPMNTACRAGCPVLLVHGSADNTVPVTDAQAILEHCQEKKPELLLIDGGEHDSVDEIERHADQLIAFLERTVSI